MIVIFLLLSSVFLLLFLCVSLQRCHVVKPCITLTQRTKESWPSERVTLSPWLVESMRTGLKEPFTDKQDTSPITTLILLCHYHTENSQTKREGRLNNHKLSLLQMFFFLLVLVHMFTLPEKFNQKNECYQKNECINHLLLFTFPLYAPVHFAHHTSNTGTDEGKERLITTSSHFHKH